MSDPSPNLPRTLFPNHQTPSTNEPNTPNHTTGVDPSPIGVTGSQNVASIPSTEEALLTPQQMDHQFECLVDAAFAVQSPMLVDSTFRASAQVTQASPDFKHVKATTLVNLEATLKRENIRNIAITQNKWNKVMFYPERSMLWRVCEKYISEYADKYKEGSKCRGPNTDNNTKVAANGWRWDHKFNWGLFKNLQPKLSNGNLPLSINHNRLLLEDLMLLERGEKVRFLIAANHDWLHKKHGNIRFMRHILQSVEEDGMQPHTFR